MADEVNQEPTQAQAPATQPASPAQTKPAVDAEALRQEAIQSALKDIDGKIKEAFGVDGFAALVAQKAEQDRKAMEERGEFKRLAEEARAAQTTWQQKYQHEVARNAILSELANSNALYPDDLSVIMQGKAKVDDNGAVLIDGKPVKAYVTQFLADRPALVKATGSGGSGGKADSSSDASSETKQYEDAKKRGDVVAMLRLNPRFGTGA